MTRTRAIWRFSEADASDSPIESLGGGRMTPIVQAPPTPQAFLIAGQSNAEGYGSASALTDASYANAYSAIPIIMQAAVRQEPITWRYYDGSTIHASSGTADPPSTFGDVAPHFFPGVHPDLLGPECSIARELVSGSHGVDRLVKFTLAGSNLATDWLNASYPATPPSLRDQFYAYVDAALSAFGGVIAGVYWNQGENDAKLNADASAYTTSLSTFWDAFFCSIRALPPDPDEAECCADDRDVSVSRHRAHAAGVVRE